MLVSNVEIVRVVESRGAAGPEQRHRVTSHHLLAQADVAAAQHIVLVDEVRKAQAGLDDVRVLADNVEDLVVAAHPVEADAEVRRQARSRPPVVLHVDGVVPVARQARRQLERRSESPVERNRALRRVCRVHLAPFFEDEAVIQVLGRRVVGAARRPEEAGLELVRSGEAVLEVCEVGSQRDLR
jgi:hypothetical protein